MASLWILPKLLTSLLPDLRLHFQTSSFDFPPCYFFIRRPFLYIFCPLFSVKGLKLTFSLTYLNLLLHYLKMEKSWHEAGTCTTASPLWPGADLAICHGPMPSSSPLSQPSLPSRESAPLWSLFVTSGTQDSVSEFLRWVCSLRSNSQAKRCFLDLLGNFLEFSKSNLWGITVLVLWRS